MATKGKDETKLTCMRCGHHITMTAGQFLRGTGPIVCPKCGNGAPERKH